MIAAGLLVCMKLVGNRTMPAKGASHVCGKSPQEESIVCLLERPKRTQEATKRVSPSTGTLTEGKDWDSSHGDDWGQGKYENALLDTMDRPTLVPVQSPRVRSARAFLYQLQGSFDVPTGHTFEIEAEYHLQAGHYPLVWVVDLTVAGHPENRVKMIECAFQPL
ncbi:hypothetical protein N7540_009355 [Penicillium herquei]|nr:hypothetical protein N7540_009355 [Penicillium herquei]